MNKIRALLLGLAMVGVGVVTTALPAQATQPYHIKYNQYSNDLLYIFSENGCKGSRHTLRPGQDAHSLGWDSFTVYDYFSVHVYSGTTQNLLAVRDYAPNACVQAYNANYYFITSG